MGPVNRPVRALVRPLVRMGRPLVRRVRPRVVHWANQASDPRFERLEKSVGDLQADVAGLERYVPALLSAIAAQNAASRANARSDAELAQMVTSMLEELESLRNRLSGGGRPEHHQEPKILRPERVAAAEGQVRLHLGSGGGAEQTHLSVDPQLFDGTDVLAAPTNLPFDPGSVAEIRADHVLETYERADIERAVLPHWLALLAPGGLLEVTVPDAGAAVRDYVAGRLSFEGLREATLGDGVATRSSMFDKEVLTGLLAAAGLEEIEVRSVPTGGAPDLRVIARKADPDPT